MRSGVWLEKAVFGFLLRCGDPSEGPSGTRCSGLSRAMGEGLHEPAWWSKKEGNWPTAFRPVFSCRKGRIWEAPWQPFLAWRPSREPWEMDFHLRVLCCVPGFLHRAYVFRPYSDTTGWMTSTLIFRSRN